jgi:hypothetical protein
LRQIVELVQVLQFERTVQFEQVVQFERTVQFERMVRGRTSPQRCTTTPRGEPDPEVSVKEKCR